MAAASVKSVAVAKTGLTTEAANPGLSEASPIGEKIIAIWGDAPISQSSASTTDNDKGDRPMLSALIQATRRSVAPTGGAAVTTNLNFAMQTQKESQWCWSTVATSTSLHYNAASTWTQCKVVNAELSLTTCCQSGGSTACNQPWYLDLALTRTKNFHSKTTGSLPYATVKQQIVTSRPLGVRIGWAGGGGHFVIVDGYDSTSGQFLSIRDPFHGTSTYAYSAFLTSYQGSGSWTHSYYTQP